LILDALHVISIKIGFKENPTLDPVFRQKNQRINLTIFIGLILYLFLMPKIFGTACVIQGITGFPCPTCGSTRAFGYLIRGDWQAAFFWHPLIVLSLFILFSVLVYIIWQDVLLLRAFRSGKKINLYSNTKIWYVFVPIFILYIIIYIYRLVKLWPSPPMNYNLSSVLGRVYIWIEEIFRP